MGREMEGMGKEGIARGTEGAEGEIGYGKGGLDLDICPGAQSRHCQATTHYHGCAPSSTSERSRSTNPQRGALSEVVSLLAASNIWNSLPQLY